MSDILMQIIGGLGGIALGAVILIAVSKWKGWL